MGPNRSQLTNSSGCIVLVPVGPFGFDIEVGFDDFPVMHALHCIVSKMLVGISIFFTSGRDERVRNEICSYLS